MLRSSRALLLAAISLSSFLAAPAPAHAQARKVLLIGVGGNSECRGGGIRELMLDQEILQQTLSGALRAAIDARYFSWTGDGVDSPGCLPGHLDWVLGGSAHIQASLRKELRPGRSIAIVGWSNGGATAYELACDLTKRGLQVKLLVTLDAAAWTTRPCRKGEGASIPVRPAQRWIAVYTESEGFHKFLGTNLIGYFGRAWDDQFPYSPSERADVLMKLKPANHGDTMRMWTTCVAPTLRGDKVCNTRS